MRPSTANGTHGRSALAIPRGWIIAGAATVSWVILLTVLYGASSLFSFVVSGI